MYGRKGNEVKGQQETGCGEDEIKAVIEMLRKTAVRRGFANGGVC